MKTLQLRDVAFGQKIASERQYLAKLEINHAEFFERLADLDGRWKMASPSENTQKTVSSENTSDPYQANPGQVRIGRDGGRHHSGGSDRTCG